jgi:hypothetical protein
VVFKGGNELIGKLVTVKIEKTGPATLVGKGDQDLALVQRQE